MNLSGIAVKASPSDVEAVAERLGALPGVQIAQFGHASGRLVLVQEAATVADEVASFRAIQATPGVLCVDLVCHYVGDQTHPEPDLSRVLAHLNGGSHDDGAPREVS